ncbi:ABC transporter permease [Bacillaceae bacterium]
MERGHTAKHERWAERWSNPLIVKEMRERFRSPKTVWILALYLFVMGAILLGFIYIETTSTVGFRPGENRELFILLAVIQSALIGFVTPALSAGTISGERERQTLNILLTTHLTPGSIVRSKLITSLSFVLLLLIASFPLYSFVFLYGGISPRQLVQLFLFFLVNIFFLGSLGLFCSTWIKRTGAATITAYGFTFFYAIGTGLLILFLHQWLSIQMHIEDPHDLLAMELLMSLNPGLVLLEILEEGNRVIDAEEFSPWLVFATVYLALSVVLVFGSGRLLHPLKRRRRML